MTFRFYLRGTFIDQKAENESSARTQLRDRTNADFAQKAQLIKVWKD